MKLAGARQPFVGLALAALAGIFVAEARPSVAPLLLAPFFLMGVAAWWTRRSLLTFLFVAGGFYLMHSARLLDSDGLRLAEMLGPRSRPVTVVGTVATEPRTGASPYSTFVLALRTIEAGGKVHTSRAKIFVRWRGLPRFGEQIRVRGMIGPVPPPRNPGEFDLRAYLARRDIHRQLFARYEEDGSVLAEPSGHHVLRAAQASRRWMEGVLTRDLAGASAEQALITATVLGTRQRAPDDIEEPFQKTGTLHLFSVSGLHVAILALLLWVVARLLRLPRTAGIAVIIPALLFYAAVTGLNTASVRAALMTSVVFLGLFVERRVYSLNTLAAVAFLVLAWNTQELFSVGFQLSFCVVTALILLAGPILQWLRRLFAQDEFLPPALYGRWRRALEGAVVWTAGAFSVSLAAWLGSLPLIYSNYHLVTPVSLLANLFVVPLAYGMLAAGLLSLLCAPVFTWLSLVFNHANWVIAKLMLALVHFFAALPGSHFYVGPLPPPVEAVAEITVLDLGAGGAVHLRSNGADWLFDAGSRRDYERVLQPYLRSRGVNRLDGLVLSHGDAQHLGGASLLLRELRPRLVVDNPLPDRSRVHRALREEFSAGGIAVDPPAGGRWSVGDNVEVRLLYPSPGQLPATAADDQAMVVQLVVPPATVILLMSDSGEKTEKALLASGIDLRSDLVVMSRHHADPSGTLPFLEAVAPEVIVAGARPFPEEDRLPDKWVEEVQRAGIRLFRQDEEGAVQIVVTPSAWQVRGHLSGRVFEKERPAPAP